MVRKQLKGMNMNLAHQENNELLKKQIAEKDSTIEKLSYQVSSLKKEEEAIRILSQELDYKNKEKAELNSKVEMLQAEVANHEYDLQKTKADKEQAINLYEQRIKKLAEEFNLSKRETLKLREHMSKSTPVKSSKRDVESELQRLRDELQEKSKVIQQLEEMIPSRTT